MTRLLDTLGPDRFGSPEPVVGFSDPLSSRSRCLTLNGEDAYDLGWVCGTCAFIFKRLSGASEPVGVEETRNRLKDTSTGIDKTIVEAFSRVLPETEYLVTLLEIQPQLVTPMLKGDYFSEEQIESWGPAPFTGLPEYPNVAYYRAGRQDLGPEERFFEFVVPMVPATWNDLDTVADYELALLSGQAPTAVALSVLDIAEPATSCPPQHPQRHWGLMHFLLDGHHKMEAAAITGRPVRLLSFLALTEGTSGREQALRVPTILGAS